MILTVIEYVLSPIIVALCGYITYLLKDNRKTSNANARGTMLLLRKQIIAAHEKYVVKGDPMCAFDFEDLQEIHDAYKDLKGNGLTDKMWEEIQEVKVENPNVKGRCDQ